MNKIKTLIVDDEVLARKRICRLLQNDPDIEISGECSNGLDAINAINNLKPDLVFLDIQMPKLNGFEVIEKLDVEKFPIMVFVTAYDQFALKAFEVHAVDYLLKPFDDDRFFDSLNYAKEQVLNSGDNSLTEKLFSMLSSSGNGKSNYLERISIKDSGRIYLVKTRDIVRIKAAGKYLEINDGANNHVLRQTMTDLQKKLNPELFIRIHRSVIINIEFIKEIQHWYKNEYTFVLKNGERFTSGSSYRTNLDVVLNK